MAINKMAMEFDKLTLDQRAELLWSKGTFVTSTEYYSRKVNLYTMDGNYFEVWYDVLGNIIEKIIPIENSKLFQGYLKKN